MTTLEKVHFVSKYSDRILELIEDSEDLTTSDLQGAADAIVMSILHDLEKGQHDNK